MPEAKSMNEWLDFVKSKIPELDKPSLFGHPENLGATYELEQNALWNWTVKKIHSTLANIRKGLAGKLAPTAKTVQAAKTLLDQQTPVDWDLIWPGPEDCYHYMEKVCDKARKVKKLSTSISGQDLLNEAIDLDHLFRPTALLNALRQYSARHLNVGVNRLQFVTSLSKMQSRAPSMQTGQLKIQGAVLGGGHLMAVDQNSAAISSAPVIHVAWIGMDEPEPYRQEESAEIPLFVASNRTAIALFTRICIQVSYVIFCSFIFYD
uniref:Dynein_C domain-containing protein n=1 Tax=Bursaphelenchus xylophilus TaxID=6326 RepID=A0A1I7SG34_BURXY